MTTVLYIIYTNKISYQTEWLRNATRIAYSEERQNKCPDRRRWTSPVTALLVTAFVVALGIGLLHGVSQTHIWGLTSAIMPKRSQLEDSDVQDEENRASASKQLFPAHSEREAPRMQGISTQEIQRVLRDLASSPTSSYASREYSRKFLRHAYTSPLDRVNVLGDERGYGHTGYV